MRYRRRERRSPSLCLLFLLFGLCLLLGGVAPAQAGTLGDAMANTFAGTVAPILTAALLGLVGVGINWARKKWKLDALASLQGLAEAAALRGIAYAEEKAEAAIKKGGDKIPGNEKLQLAVAQVLEAVPKISPERATAIVEGMLGRVVGAGASGTKAVTPASS